LGLNLHNHTNLNRLDIQDNMKDKRIYATLKGLTGPQRDDVSEYFNHELSFISLRAVKNNRSQIYNYNAYDLLREEVRFRY